MGQLHDLCELLTKQAHFAGDTVKDDKMGGERGTCGGEEKCLQRFGGENLRKEITWRKLT